jgi:hypothetical protein
VQITSSPRSSHYLNNHITDELDVIAYLNIHDLEDIRNFLDLYKDLSLEKAIGLTHANLKHLIYYIVVRITPRYFIFSFINVF